MLASPVTIVGTGTTTTAIALSSEPVAAFARATSVRLPLDDGCLAALGQHFPAARHVTYGFRSLDKLSLASLSQLKQSIESRLAPSNYTRWAS